MATAKEARNSEMTSEAFDLLDCFVSGLDDVIYNIAEKISEEKGQVRQDGTIEIKGEDVKRAATIVFDAIREQAGKSIPEAAVKEIESMHDCVMAKCDLHKAG
jgi:hypothetical protein